MTNDVTSHVSLTDPPPPTPPDCDLPSQLPFSGKSLFSTPLRFSQSLYQHSLPSFQWADGRDVWQTMLHKERKQIFWRDADVFAKHDGLDARMRSILLDWLIEVGKLDILLDINICDLCDQRVSIYIILLKSQMSLTKIDHCKYLGLKGNNWTEF